MEIISILILSGILLLVAYLVYFYADKSVKIHIKLLTYFSWLLSFGFVFLVPIDIYFTFQKYKDPNLVKVETQQQINPNNDTNNQNKFLEIQNDYIIQNINYQQNLSRILEEIQGDDALNENQSDNQQQVDNQIEPEQKDQENKDQYQNLPIKDQNLRQDVDVDYIETVYHRIEIVWRSIWWICFFMTWIILPFFQEYEDAGDFTMVSKIKTSIVLNLKLYGLMILGGAAFVIYLTITGTITLDTFGGFAVLMVNCFGLLLVVLLLGHGLVALPKKYWLQKNTQVMLKYSYFSAAQIDNDIQDATYQLEDEVKNLQVTIQKNITHQHINQLKKHLDEIPANIMKAANESRSKGNSQSDMDDKKLAKINRLIKNKLANYNRLQHKYESNLDMAFMSEDIIKAKNNPQKKIQGVFWVQREGKIGDVLDKITWIWHTKLKKFFYIGFSILFMAFSISVLLGELGLFLSTDLSMFEFLIYSNSSYFSILFYSLIPLAYITFCVYYGLFNMRVQGFFGFYKNQNTDATSLMFGSINFTRVSAPICYNFLQMIKVNLTAFNSIMGQMDVFPVVYYIFPILLLIVSCFNVFDIYKKIMSIFGFTQFSFSDDFNDEGIEEGRKIVQRARLQKEKQFLELSSVRKMKPGYNSQLKKHDPKSDEEINMNLSQKHTLSSSLTSTHSSGGRQTDAEQYGRNSNEPALKNNYYNFGSNAGGNQHLNDILNI